MMKFRKKAKKELTPEQQAAKAAKKQRARGLTVLAFVLVIIASILLFLELWAFTTWTGLTMDEMIYHLSAPLQGTGNGIIGKGFLHTLLPTAAVAAALIVVVRLIRKNRHFRKIMRAISLIGLAGIVVAVSLAWVRLDLGSYLNNQLNASTFIEDNYVDPAKTDITFPSKKRNLIYIYLESMEATYSDKENGGGFTDDYIPELTTLAENNQCFAGNSGKLNGGEVLPGSTYTMAGIFTQSTGLPLKVDLGEEFTDGRGSFNKMNTQSHFFSKVTALGDILEDQGYKQVFMLGSDATFGGRKLYFTDHGNFDIDDYNWAIEQGKIPSDYYVFWGYEDEKLFANAKDELTQLGNGDQPFNFTMLTVDTHFEDGYYCDLCEDQWPGNQYADVMSCSSRQVSAFIDWCKEQSWYDNTTIVINGDHLTMDSDFCNPVSSDYQRKTYTCYINSAVVPEDESAEREYSTLDNFPTTLAAMGVKIKGDRLGLGTNLFSNKKTLIEQYGYDDLSDELSRRSKFMENLADINVYSEDLMKAQGLTPSGKVTVSDFDEDNKEMTVKVSDIENVYEKISSVEAQITSDDSPDKTVKAKLKYNSKKETYSGDIDLSDINYKNASLKIYANGKSGTTYELGHVTGDMSLKTTDIVEYLDRLKENLDSNPDYVIFIALRDDGTHSLDSDMTSRLADLGLKYYLPGHYRWSYYALITPDGVEKEELSQDQISTTGTLSDGAEYTLMSEGGLSGAGGGAGRYLTCSVKIDGVEYAVQKIGLNFVVYDTKNSKVVDSVEFNTYQGLGARRLDPYDALENARADGATLTTAKDSTETGSTEE